MRDQSLSLRLVVLAVLLPTAVGACVVALVAAGVLHARIAHLVATGGAILIVAILAAAISALGPKYRPTPLLTPLFAGVFAALLFSTALYAAHSHIAAKHSAAVARLDVKPTVRPVKTAPVIAKASVEPDLAASPQEQAPAVPAFDASAFAAPAKAQDQMQADGQSPAKPDVQPLPNDTTDQVSTAGPLENVVNAVVPPAQASERVAAADASSRPAAAADETSKPPVAVARIPVPEVAPAAAPSPDAPINLSARFDPTGPTWPQADGPPIPLIASAAALPHSAIPPLPRIRPCGGAGPACP